MNSFYDNKRLVDKTLFILTNDVLFTLSVWFALTNPQRAPTEDRPMDNHCNLIRRGGGKESEGKTT